MAMVKSVEKLRQLEHVLGQMCRFGGGDALVDDVGSFRRRQPEFPEVVVSLAEKESGKIGGGDVASHVSTEIVGIESTFAENVCRADHGILRVRTSLAFKAQRLFEIEGDDGGLGELEHEVAQSADGDLGRDGGAFGVCELGMTWV